MKPRKIHLFIIIGLLSLNTGKVCSQQPLVPFKSPVRKLAEQYLDEKINSVYFNQLTGYYKKDSTRIDTIKVNVKTKTIELHLDPKFTYAPYREATLDSFIYHLHNYLGESYKDYEIGIFSNQKNIAELIPNYYRSHKKDYDKKRLLRTIKKPQEPLVKNISKPYPDEANLDNFYIALWHSHGYYYEQKLQRWEWQRARLFQTVEDISTLSYTLKYLTPMLENAGAVVLLPRERDWQTNEVIVDNNGSQNQSIYKEHVSLKVEYPGFAIDTPPYSNENPFQLGSSSEFQLLKKDAPIVEWIPDIPEEGFYPVYVSYKHSPNYTDNATYTVHHLGGITKFKVNQKMGGGTWIYLGKFKFCKGLDEVKGKVVLSGTPKKGQKISADAVRFGGGMGNISRNGQISHKPRYQEAARYYLQYTGIPDTLVWKFNNGKNDDYSDDYQSRGEWVNFLMGAPSGPKKNRSHPGLGIPVDISFALHTDAGVAKNDSTIGSLGIYSTTEENSVFPNGLSKMASRDLTDLIQTQLVDDIRKKYDSTWTRRGMWDKPYSEAFRPNVPTMLLELYSHQNFRDVQFGHDPQFRFDASRAIYKGILKYFAFQNGFDFIAQPLPVSHVQVQLIQPGTMFLNWKPVTDPLEETATPEGYLVYTQKSDNGFDNGIFVKKPFITFENMEPDIIYSFKITAWNKGGESFPSEVISACHTNNATDTVLIVNGFDRVATPAIIDKSGFSGYMNQIDEGVDYHMNLSFTGTQFEFNNERLWLDDDSPGHGASGAEMESQPIPGNSFDFSMIHGKSIQQAGLAFASASDESVADNLVSLSDYRVIDYIAGEEKTTFRNNDSIHGHYQVFTDGCLFQLEQYLKRGGNLFISGSYIGTDIHLQKQDSVIGKLLKYKWRTDHASRLGKVYFSDSLFKSKVPDFRFNTIYHPFIYAAEAPDAIVPYDTTATTFMRYGENNMSAGIVYSGPYNLIAVGFPFETIIDETTRHAFMKKMMDFLLRKN